MNQNHKKSLVVAIAASLGIITAPVFGAPYEPLNRSSATGKVVEEPRYMPLESKETSSVYHILFDDVTISTDTNLLKNSGDLVAYIYTKPGYPVSGLKSLTVRVSLSNGAKFAVTPGLICPHSAAYDQDTNGTVAVGESNTTIGTNGITAAVWSMVTAAAGVTAKHNIATPANSKTAYYQTPTNQTPGLNAYSFILPDGLVLPAKGSGACLLVYTATFAAGISGGTSAIKAGAAGQDIKLYSEITYDDVFTKVTETATIPMISFVTAYKADFQKKNPQGAVNTAASAVVDVVILSKQFLKDGGGNIKEALATYVTVTAVDPTRKVYNMSGVQLSAGDIVQSASITVSGSTIATLSKVSFVLPSQADCAAASVIESSPTVATTSGGAAGAVSVRIIGGDINPYKRLVSGAPTDHSGFLVCLIADGTQVMQEGQVTVSVVGFTPGGSTLELGSSDSNNSVQVKRNGVALRVLNIPEPKDPYAVNVRLYNASSQKVDVYGSLYAMDGKIIADAIPLAKELAPYSVKNVKSSEIGTLAGGKTWAGRAWMIIQAPISPDLFKVQTIMRSPTGALTNLSTDALD